jgi:hypothetical protein
LRFLATTSFHQMPFSLWVCWRYVNTQHRVSARPVRDRPPQATKGRRKHPTNLRRPVQRLVKCFLILMLLVVFHIILYKFSECFILPSFIIIGHAVVFGLFQQFHIALISIGGQPTLFYFLQYRTSLLFGM